MIPWWFLLGLVALFLKRGGRSLPDLLVYAPSSPEAVKLFTEAARAAGLPEAWASNEALHAVLKRESGGRVGIPNGTFGSKTFGEVLEVLRAGTWRPGWAGPQNTSSASGLGQLLMSNTAKYYPSGIKGIGVALEEAVGMLRYIADRYGTPENAWTFWQRNKWY